MVQLEVGRRTSCSSKREGVKVLSRVKILHPPVS